MKISIIHPSRSRPELAESTCRKWLDSAVNPENIEYLFSIDADDPNIDDYMLMFNVWFAQGVTIHVGLNNGSAIDAINNAAKKATGDIIIVVSDDFDCPKNWDVDLLNICKGKQDFIVKTWDGLQPWIMTLPIMDRVYYDRFGYIYYPEYKHMFCDTEMTHVADLLDKVIIANLHFPHRHYSQKGGILKDHISKKNDSTWSQGENLYLERMANNFGLKDDEIKGVLRCNQGHIKWLQSKGVQIEMI